MEDSGPRERPAAVDRVAVIVETFAGCALLPHGWVNNCMDPDGGGPWMPPDGARQSLSGGPMPTRS